MKNKILLPLIAVFFLFTGCYTQLGYDSREEMYVENDDGEYLEEEELITDDDYAMYKYNGRFGILSPNYYDFRFGAYPGRMVLWVGADNYLEFDSFYDPFFEPYDYLTFWHVRYWPSRYQSFWWRHHYYDSFYWNHFHWHHNPHIYCNNSKPWYTYPDVRYRNNYRSSTRDNIGSREIITRSGYREFNNRNIAENLSTRVRKRNGDRDSFSLTRRSDVTRISSGRSFSRTSRSIDGISQERRKSSIRKRSKEYRRINLYRGSSTRSSNRILNSNKKRYRSSNVTRSRNFSQRKLTVPRSFSSSSRTSRSSYSSSKSRSTFKNYRSPSSRSTRTRSSGYGYPGSSSRSTSTYRSSGSSRSSSSSSRSTSSRSSSSGSSRSSTSRSR